MSEQKLKYPLCANCGKSTITNPKFTDCTNIAHVSNYREYYRGFYERKTTRKSPRCPDCKKSMLTNPKYCEDCQNVEHIAYHKSSQAEYQRARRRPKEKYNDSIAEHDAPLTPSIVQ